MDKQRRDLVRHIFAIAAGTVEQAHQAAMSGQSHKLTTVKAAQLAERLLVVSEQVRSLADAIRVVSRERG